MLKRLNRQLGQRLNDIERLTDQLRNSSAEYSELYKQLDNEKRKFENELDEQMRGAKDRIAEEKQKMDELIEKTTANLNARNSEKVKVLEDEVALLKQLLESRRGDLEAQRETLLVQRDSYRLEIEKL